MVTLDGRFLDRAVHALDLTIGPRMLDLGQPMFDAILLAAQIEHMCRVSCRRAVRVSWWESELGPIIGEDRVDVVWDRRKQSFEERRGWSLAGPNHLIFNLTERLQLWRRRSDVR